jgi:hypothetical protein
MAVYMKEQLRNTRNDTKKDEKSGARLSFLVVNVPLIEVLCESPHQAANDIGARLSASTPGPDPLASRAIYATLSG